MYIKFNFRPKSPRVHGVMPASQRLCRGALSLPLRQSFLPWPRVSAFRGPLHEVPTKDHISSPEAAASTSIHTQKNHTHTGKVGSTQQSPCIHHFSPLSVNVSQGRDGVHGVSTSCRQTPCSIIGPIAPLMV